MKKITMLFSCLLCFTSFSSFATVSDGDKNFCSAFIDESISMCHQADAGGCDIPRNYDGMQQLYSRISAAGGGGHTDVALRLGCKVATLKIHQPSEAENCFNKWKCFEGQKSDSTCINPPGKHC